MKTKQIKLVIVALLMATIWHGCKKADPDPMPTADFSFVQSSGGVIQFTDKSLSARTYAWNFGNGTTSTEKSPKVAFVSNGDYTVKLTVKNNAGENSIERTVTVTSGRDLPIKADFTFALLPNGEVQFTNKSVSASTYKWDFGYGLTSTEKNPKIALTYNGDYKVKLEASKSFDGAEVEKTVTIANGKALPQVSDEYSTAKGTSGGTYYSFRNHFYTFEVTEDNKNVTANVQSGDIDVAFYWYNSLGQDLNKYGSFSGPEYGRNFTDTQKLNKGKYTLLVTTRNRYAIGKYTVSVRGIDAAPVRVPSARLLDTNKDFGDGGGGLGNDSELYFLSPRNKTYTFDVAEDNTYVDIDATSTSADTWVKIFNSLGQSQNYASIGSGRTPNVNLKVNKGSYTLLVGTIERLAKTNFSLEINGKVSNLKEKIFNSLKIDGKWQKTKTIVIDNSNNVPRSYDEYSFEITEDKTILDATSASTFFHSMTIKNSIGVVVGEDVYFDYKTRNMAINVSKGKYVIRIYTRNEASDDAYSFTLVGMVANLKKL